MLALAVALTQVAGVHSAGLQEPPSNRAGALSRSWKQLRAPAFTVMGDAPEAVLASIRTDIESFRAAIGQLSPSLQPDSPVPMSVVVFKDDAAFDRFRPRDSRGKTMPNVGGYFASRPYANLIVFPSSGRGFDYRTIFHEYAHYLLHRSGHPLPMWMDEGLAEFYSTFSPNYQGKAVIGRAWAGHLAGLRTRTFIPLKTLLAPPSADMEKMWRSPTWIAHFYAESWALVHYLIVERKASLNGYLGALSRAQSPEVAFREGLGLDLDIVDRELRNYVRRFSFSAIAYEPVADRSPAEAAVRMREVDVRRLHGALLVELGAFEDAESEAQAVLELEPGNAEARVTLARARSGRDRRPEAVALLEDLARTDPAHAAGQYYLGVSLAASWRHADAMAAFERALRLNDAVTHPWMGLSASALALGRDAQAGAALQHALQIEANPALYRAHASDAFAFGRDLTAAAAVRSYIDGVGWADEAAQYAAFIAALAYWRAGQPGEAENVLASAQEAVQPKTWTFSVLQFLRGQLDPDQFLALAKEAGPQTEAHAYIGFKEQIAGHEAAALGHFRWVADRGAKTYTEFAMVKRELDRLEWVARNAGQLPPK